MRLITRIVVLGLGLLAGSARAAKPKIDEPISVHDLFRSVNLNRMALSPDGKMLASIYPRENGSPGTKNYWTALGVLRIDDHKPMKLLDRDDTAVEDFWWVGDHRLVVEFVDAYGGWGLFSCNGDGSDNVTLVDARPEYRGIKPLFAHSRMVHPLVDNPDEILIARPRRNEIEEAKIASVFGATESAPGVYRMNVRTAKFHLVVRDPEKTDRWLADRTGHIRIAVSEDANAFTREGNLKDRAHLPVGHIFWINDDGSAELIEGIHTGFEDEFEPVGINDTGDGFYFLSRQKSDRAGLYLYSRTRRAIEKTGVEDARVDLSRAHRSRLDTSPVSVTVESGKPHIHYLDARLAAMQPGIDEAIPEFVNQFSSWDRALDRVLVVSTSEREPGRYYLFDRKKETIEEVFQVAPWLNGHRLGIVEPITFPARDGTRLDGYLTRPGDAKPGERRPLILLVHGGPWTIRDHYGFDPEVQFYATRGYTVLQVNYRGSSGYGRAFEHLSWREIGLAMQDDLNDAVRWAIDRGLADPKRIAIAGNSYGGYAALRGVTRDPALFHIGIAGFAPSDLVAQIEYLKKSADADFAYHFWIERAGDPVVDRDRLLRVSPMYAVDKIKVPLFIVYGERDRIVDYQQTGGFVKALREGQKEFVRFAPPKEQHGLFEEEHRYEIYEELEKFLLKYMPAR